MSALFECVPNVSEGRDEATFRACASAIRDAGAHLAHQTSDAAHHRSVFTFFGDEAAVVRAGAQLAKTCVERIDLRLHRGRHPRIGALDVFPVVPMRGATLDDAARVARLTAQAIWESAGLPSFLYGAAALTAGRVTLADVRRAEFEGLSGRKARGERPDAGDVLFHETAGAVAVGAREILIAINFELDTARVEVAGDIARCLRERGGGLQTLRALGLQTGAHTVQVSCNLTDARLPLHRLTQLVERMARRRGVALAGCELIGLLPRQSVAQAVRDHFGGDVACGENPGGCGQRSSMEAER